MDSANFMDEMECGNFFDHIDDLLDFPTDDLDTNLIGASAECGSFPSVLAGSSSDALLSSDSVFSGSTVTDLSDQLSVPYEDIVQLEWLSNFVEDSFSGGGMTMESQIHHQFQTSSPISVLESSSSSCSNGNKKARSKRPRPPTFTPRPAIQLTETKQTLKKIKIVPPSNPSTNAVTQAPVRKCLHCEITKTPQWRAGPMGPKTLCNACGVRHKSGRLFPEYRPAASPTFVPSVHSNSHKKVIQMRTKTGEEKQGMDSVN